MVSETEDIEEESEESSEDEPEEPEETGPNAKEKTAMGMFQNRFLICFEQIRIFDIKLKNRKSSFRSNSAYYIAHKLWIC